ncbi:MAG: hypothetical protein QNJ72_06895 [Pleurocapsa sp. MO_226.B13]|nr:hypothetical protein [Pleurocapsa sp. MO_226.B13]
MNEPDYQDLKINKPIEPPSLTQVESIMPGFNTVLQINHAVRRLIFDYALIAAILGLFRFYNVGSVLIFLTLLLLNLVMAIHISRHWRTFKDKKLVTITNLSLSFLSSFVLAILVRGLFSILSIFIPLMIVLNAPVGHAIFTLLFGNAVNQLYLSAKEIDRQTLEKILKNKSLI